jgi:hypothetical protein
VPQAPIFVIAAGLCAIGAAIGVGLGHATVDQINPADFQDPPFASDLAPGHSSADWAQVQAEEYRTAAQQAEPESCAGCTWPVAPVPPEDPAIARYDQPRTAAVPPARTATAVPQERVEAPVRTAAVEAPPEPDWGRVQRYAHYPVEQPVQAAADANAVATQASGDTGTQ